MEDLISRKEALGIAAWHRDHGWPDDTIHRIYEDIAELPAIDAEPVQHGKWIEGTLFTGASKLNCSECGAQAPPVPGTHILIKFNYYHVCGARMGEREGSK